FGQLMLGMYLKAARHSLVNWCGWIVQLVTMEKCERNTVTNKNNATRKRKNIPLLLRSSCPHEKQNHLRPHCLQYYYCVSEVGNLLLVAAVVKSLSENGGTRNLDENSIPLSESLVLQILRRSSVQLLEASNGTGNVIPDTFVCNELFVALRKADMREEFSRVFDKLREKNRFALDLWGYNICIHAFGCWGDLGLSLSLFREMKQRSHGSEIKDALIVWDELKGSGHEPDASTYRIIIQGCCKSYRIEDAVKILSEMQYNGFCPDTVVYNSVLDGLMKARRLTEACQLFERMVEDGVRASCWTYNILIDGLLKNGRGVAGYTMFCDLKKKGQFVDGVTYSIVILWLCREGQIAEALQLVEEMEARGFVVDLVTVTSLLIGFQRQGRWDWTERIMKHIRDGNLVPTVLKWKADMEASMKSPQSRKKDFSPIFPCKGDFSEITYFLSSPDLGIGEAGGQLEDRSASMTPTSGYTYNAMMSSFVKKGYFNEAWGVLHEMGEHVCPADIGTYNVIIQGLGKMGNADLVNAVWDKLAKQGGYLDIVMYNTLINALGKAGRVDEANNVFEQMRTSGINPDVVTYNTLIQVHTVTFLMSIPTISGDTLDAVSFKSLIFISVSSSSCFALVAFEYLLVLSWNPLEAV
ncbi:hypothetical protein C3L33_11363, partial [Rhododendron williamsianum]